MHRSADVAGQVIGIGGPSRAWVGRTDPDYAGVDETREVLAVDVAKADDELQRQRKQRQPAGQSPSCPRQTHPQPEVL